MFPCTSSSSPDIIQCMAMSPYALFEEFIASWDLHRTATDGTGEYQV